MDYDDKKLQENLASLKSDNISALRAKLVGCLDEDQFGHDEPQTLEMSKYLDEKTQGRIFEEDDGCLDFNLPMTTDTVRKIKAHLRTNFSREKLEFATKIIAFIKQTEQKNVEQQPIVAENPKTEGNKPSTSTAQSAEAVVPKISKDVITVATDKSVKRTSEPSSTNSSARIVEDFTYPETPQASTPSAQNAKLPGRDELSLNGNFSQESPQAFSEETSSKEIKDSRKAPSSSEKQTTQGKARVHLMDEQKSQSNKHEDKEHQQGFFERKFAKVGRIMDKFLKEHFGICFFLFFIFICVLVLIIKKCS